MEVIVKGCAITLVPLWSTNDALLDGVPPTNSNNWTKLSLWTKEEIHFDWDWASLYPTNGWGEKICSLREIVGFVEGSLS